MREMLRVMTGKWFWKMSAKDCYKSKRRKRGFLPRWRDRYTWLNNQRRNVLWSMSAVSGEGWPWSGVSHPWGNIFPGERVQHPHFFCRLSAVLHKCLSTVALCLCSLQLPPLSSLSCCCFRHDTGFGTDRLMIGCSALSPASLAGLDVLLSSGVYLGQVFPWCKFHKLLQLLCEFSGDHQGRRCDQCHRSHLLPWCFFKIN